MKIKNKFNKALNYVADIKTMEAYELEQPMNAVEAFSELLITIRVLQIVILGVTLFALYEGSLAVTNYASMINN